MTFTITQVEVVSCLVGILIGYKGKALIQGWISGVKKAIATALTAKPPVK